MWKESIVLRLVKHPGNWMEEFRETAEIITIFVCGEGLNPRPYG
jgi:hypothetical protein